MKPLFTQKELESAKTTDLLPCQCQVCNNSFTTTKKSIMYSIKGTRNTATYCSKKCLFKELSKKIEVSCLHCYKTFEKPLNQYNKYPKHFCSKSCFGTYNNTHKTTGNRRSKLEIWLEQQLTMLYTNFEFHFNNKTTIGSELDIYIPSLNIAFELNGIFHYEPIYGIDKLTQIKNNDISKTKACHDKKIDLCIIDTSQQKYVKPKTSQKYLDIICDIINERL